MPEHYVEQVKVREPKELIGQVHQNKIFKFRSLLPVNEPRNGDFRLVAKILQRSIEQRGNVKCCNLFAFP